VTVSTHEDESRAVAERYARRGAPDRYSLLQPDVWQTLQERQRAEWQLWARLGWHDLAQRRYCEVGCGAGGALLEALRAGFGPEQLTGIELLPQRHAMARRVLPAAVTLHLGDALAAPVPEASQDVVAQHTVFSSLLDDGFQARLAQAMWRWVKPGGGVLWYDFTVDNPRNRDVRGVPLKQVRALFPEAAGIMQRRITLAPPLARAVCRVHPSLYTLCNAVPLLRTHLLCWIWKAA
jgi:SAM-dependent methyltransferase